MQTLFCEKLNKMWEIISEDEHYIYEMISSNWLTCTIRRTEKPKKEILWMRFADWNYQFFVKTYSKNKDDIISVHFRNTEEYLIEWTYDYKIKKFDDEFIHSIKCVCRSECCEEWCEEWDEEFCDEFLSNLQEYIELMIDLYRDIEWTIKKLKEWIESKEKLISFFKKYDLDDWNELEEELKQSYELLHKFENIYSKMEKQWKH